MKSKKYIVFNSENYVVCNTLNEVRNRIRDIRKNPFKTFNKKIFVDKVISTTYHKKQKVIIA